MKRKERSDLLCKKEKKEETQKLKSMSFTAERITAGRDRWENNPQQTRPKTIHKTEIEKHIFLAFKCSSWSSGFSSGAVSSFPPCHSGS